MKFENSGLPDDRQYKRAFEKAVKSITASVTPFMPKNDVLQAFEDFILTPAKILCSINLPKNIEETLVMIVLGGEGFKFFADKKTEKLKDAFRMGPLVLGTDLEDLIKKSNALTPEERLMTQVSIYTLMHMVAEKLEKDINSNMPQAEKFEKTKTIARNTEELKSVYGAISKQEYPQLDALFEGIIKKTLDASENVEAPRSSLPSPLSPRA